MKLAVLVDAAARAKNSSWLKKEWEVQNAYFADEEIILSDPSIRNSSKRNNEIKLVPLLNMTHAAPSFPFFPL